MLEYIEKIIRKNFYLYLISRFLVGKFFYNFVYDSDFNFFKHSSIKFNYIIDIGGNDGISSKILRKFNKDAEILCIEPNKFYENNLLNIKNKDKKFKYILSGVSNQSKHIIMYIPKYKNFYFGSLASTNKKSFFLENSFLTQVGIKQKNFDKVQIEEFNASLITLDSLKIKTDLIKIDVEGHELEVIEGALNTIEHFKPIIIIEINKNNFKKVLALLLTKDYLLSIYDNKIFKLITYPDVNNFDFLKFEKWLKQNKYNVNNCFFYHKDKVYI